MYEFDRLQYGDRPAACILMIVVGFLAEIGQSIDMEAAARIVKDSYVDDFLTGGSEEEVNRFVGDKKPDGTYDGSFTKIFAKANFEIKTFVRSYETDQEAMDKLGGKVLGYGWNVDKDMMTVTVHNSDKTNPILTKRSILSFIMKIFDPLGIVAHLVIKYKLGMKELILHVNEESGKQLSWDEEIPNEYKIKWEKHLAEAVDIKEIRFERSIRPKEAKDVCKSRLREEIMGVQRLVCLLPIEEQSAGK